MLKRVLFVDDERGIRNVAQREIPTFGDYDVVVAEDGAEALQLLTGDEGFDCVLSDITMSPGMGGLEFVRLLRERGDRTKVGLMTGNVYRIERELEDLVALGLIHPLVLDKPFTKEELRVFIMRVLAG